MFVHRVLVVKVVGTVSSHKVGAELPCVVAGGAQKSCARFSVEDAYA